jgi:ribosomal 50S subunit-associated protein YjgA (DUF615 family)
MRLAPVLKDDAIDEVANQNWAGDAAHLFCVVLHMCKEKSQASPLHAPRAV